MLAVQDMNNSAKDKWFVKFSTNFMVLRQFESKERFVFSFLDGLCLKTEPTASTSTVEWKVAEPFSKSWNWNEIKQY